MPREKDIAWKFVIKLDGDKWRCPHCENEYLGKVTRVKSHLLKHSNKGISPCKKVPEHVSTLMGCLQLHNQVRNKDDIAWKFVHRIEDNKWRCYHCNEEFFGDLTRVRGHLLEGSSICTKVPDHIRGLMRLLLDEVAEEESREATGQSSMEPQSRDLPTQAEEAEEESREANGQSSMEPQSRDLPTQPEVAEEESREANRQFAAGIPLPLLSPESLELMEQWLNSDQQSQAEHRFHQSSTMPLSVQNSHALVPLQWDMQSNPPNVEGGTNLLFPQGENIPRSRMTLAEVESCLLEDMQMNDQQTPVGASSFQYDRTTVPHSEEPLPGCNDECGTETSPFPQQESMDIYPPTAAHVPLQVVEGEANTAGPLSSSQVQPAVVPLWHPDQLHPRYDKEYGNDARSFASQTPMDIDPSRASQHTTDSHIIKATIVDSQVPEASTNTTGPSSSQDMNRVSPIMNVRSIYSNDEEMRNLKRKVEELDHKEAVVKKHMEIESAASSVRKKPRILVEKWLKETERARNNFQMIGQANADILPPTEQVEALIREGDELIEQMLPHTRLIEARDAKGNAFLERKLIGEEIQRNIELIWNRLKENNGCKLGIYGMGGVGKTTIMMHIHNKLLKDGTFDGVLFVTVSQDFSIYKLQSDIWKALEGDVMKDEHEKQRAVMLSECLEKKENCVLILDDVWQHFKLQDVGIPCKPGLKVVLTTRLSDVCSRMDCEENKIQPLGEKEAWKLFVEELGPILLTNKQVEKVARKIANRCAGLPLAINAMARSMRGEKKVFVWQDTLNKLERSDTKHIEMGDEVLPVLKLSYERLSDPQLKQCFVFCALFPEDESIRKRELIDYFIDEGFLDELDTREEQYCRGLAIVDKLQNACLLEDNYFDSVRMHDLMRDMALHITNRTYMVKAGQALRTIPNGERWTENLEKVSLMWGRIEDIPPNMSPNCPKLSTLLLNGSLQLENVQLQDSFFMNLRGLKVLNLSECAITELPDSLLELANLRALLLRECGSLIHIPYLGKLKYLRKLDAYGCKSLSEVEGLEELSNLRYLDLSETGIKRSWKGTFSEMVNLQYLKIAGKVKAEEVIQLKELKRLECEFDKVDDFNKYVRFMECRRDHNYGLIVDQDESLWFVSESVYSDREIVPKNQIEYGIKYEFGYVYGDWERFVEIRSCDYAMARVGEERNKGCIWIPEDVKAFKGENCHGMANLSGMSRLRDLKVLKIEEWDNLVELIGGAGVDAEEIDNTQDSPAPLFPSLETLVIRSCSKLKHLFGHESRFSWPLLCEGIEGMNSSGASPPQPGESGNMKRVVGSEWLPHFPSLQWIDVRRCNNIRELFPYECLLHLPNLEGIEIYGCEKLEEIIGGGPLPSGVTCGSLTYLEVGGCHNMKRVLLTQDMSLHLPSLREISVENCKGIEVIIGALANTTHASIPKLTNLALSGLPELKSICDGDGTVSCNSLTYLTVDGCHNMKRVLLTQEVSLHLPSLREISVENCEGIEVIIGSVANTTHASFPKLTDLILSGLPELKSICDGDGTVSCDSLTYLEVGGCHNMKRVLLTQDMLLHLPSLREMSISYCKGIEVITGSVANMTHASFPKLTNLTLWYLPELKSICEGARIVSCDSLEHLVVCECPKLKRIPVQLAQLDNDEGEGLLLSPAPSLRWIEINQQTWESLEWDHPYASSSLQHLVEFLISDSESDSEIEVEISEARTLDRN